jgi:hypothetical protein
MLLSLSFIFCCYRYFVFHLWPRDSLSVVIHSVGFDRKGRFSFDGEKMSDFPSTSTSATMGTAIVRRQPALRLKWIPSLDRHILEEDYAELCPLCDCAVGNEAGLAIHLQEVHRTSSGLTEDEVWNMLVAGQAKYGWLVCVCCQQREIVHIQGKSVHDHLVGDHAAVAGRLCSIWRDYQMYSTMPRDVFLVRKRGYSLASDVAVLIPKPTRNE